MTKILLDKDKKETMFACECGGNIKVVCLECDCEVIGLNSYIQELIKQAKLELIDDIFYLKFGELFGNLNYDDILLIKSEIEKE